MAADLGYYYGWEAEVYLAIEASYGTASTTGAEYVQPTWIRGAGWNLSENIERIHGPGNAYRRGPDTWVKGNCDVTATISFWMPDDLAASCTEPFILKLPLDKYNVAHSGTVWSVPETAGAYPGDSAYGSYSLLPFTLEIGHTKTGDIRVAALKGCYVNSQTFRAEKGEKCLWTWDIVGKSVDRATSFVGSGSQTTYAPLDWSGVAITWTGEAGGAVAHSGCTMMEFTINNNLEPLRDLTGSAQDREVIDFLTGKRDIDGSMTWYKKTTVGQKWMEIVFSATAAQTTPDNTIKEGDLKIAIASRITGGAKIEYSIYDVVIGVLPEDIDFEKVTEITLPYTARYYKWDFTTTEADAMVNWDTQATV